MAANGKQKLKLLYLYKMLAEETDADHGLSMADILERLEELGIPAERKGIYRDIDVLREFGYKINTIQRMPVEYTLERTGMELSELMLLVDAVQSCRFLTKRMSARLVNQVRELASPRERDQLDKRVHVDDRVKHQNESVFHNVDVIHEAMRLKRKVSFLYYKYDINMQPVLQHDGKPYVHTPVQVVFSDGFYYLVSWTDTYEEFVRFRIDRMRIVQVTDEKATRNERIANFAFEGFAYQSFGMFDGELIHPRLRVAADAMDIVVDRFGDEIHPSACDDGTAELSVAVRKSPQFFGWVASMNGHVTIVGPAKLVDEYRTWLRGLADELPE
ncbi:MAG: helix-turn-helix transcriptional regulator [Coriobacteriales bacterium]|jgi:predicted DNA-binding transcriptional regulator YafY